jgi:molybdopterin-dependent oxidoreductase alpha subunit
MQPAYHGAACIPAFCKEIVCVIVSKVQPMLASNRVRARCAVEMTDKTDRSDRAKNSDSEAEITAAGPAAVAEVLRQLVAKPGLIRGAKGLAKMNQTNGFDCPGCAWPEDPAHQKHAEFCENGAKAFADEATRTLITAEFFERYSVEELAAKPDDWLNAQGRLSQPMVKRPNATHYTPIDWGSANVLIAQHLNALENPDQAAFYTSGRTSNEAAFLWQLFARSVGTNNLPDCSNLCHESSGTALTEVIGSGKGTVRLSDFEHADLIFVIGQNPGSNHPRMLATLQQAKDRGAKIISINPLDEVGLRKFRNPQTVKGWVGKGDDLVDLHLPIRINGDVALLQGICKAMLEADAKRHGGVLDHRFIASHTQGFEQLKTALECTSWDDIVRASGVSSPQILKAAALAIEADSTICCWAMGVTQHVNAVANIQEIVNFLLLKGNFGRPGAGACPVRGHSNVQGDRTMGIWEKPEPAFLAALATEFKFSPPAKHGLDTVGTLHGMTSGEVRVFLAMGGNFLAAAPDTGFSALAVRNCALTVQVATKLNRSHVITGATAVILPTLVRSETDEHDGGKQFVTVENSMGLVTKSQGVLPPASSDLKSEIRIVAELADKVLGAGSTVPWLRMASDYDVIRDSIDRVVPGFRDFNDRLSDEGHLELPHAVRDALTFNTTTQKALFTTHDLEPVTAGDGQYVMMTIRSHDQFNTTVYSSNDRYRGISGSRRVVFMNSADIASAGLLPGAKVNLSSHYGEQTRTMSGFGVVAYNIPAGCVATYYPETNPLIPVEQVALGSNTPAYKSVIVSIARAA